MELHCPCCNKRWQWDGITAKFVVKGKSFIYLPSPTNKNRATCANCAAEEDVENAVHVIDKVVEYLERQPRSPKLKSKSVSKVPFRVETKRHGNAGSEV